ncbi:DUF3899 domain-containing protein [Marinilactibacillus kalidii]|uniref:DUF3899 domain-containing protein n=1 Tax=Marinilactibacillus kalidii TaxID=2820274 RepID=UPI001ABDD8C8|nr:DUF3899 domain-containing protein [Marinilactibacillus kalidii]
MQKKSKFLMIISSIIVLMFIVEWILQGTITFLDTSNLFFYPASLFLILGLFGQVLRSGAFDFFHYSINKTIHRFRSSRSTEEEEESDQTPTHLSEQIGDGFAISLKIGFVLMSISLLSLLCFYLFS